MIPAFVTVNGEVEIFQQVEFNVQVICVELGPPSVTIET